MLRFSDYCLSHTEVPEEASICIYITCCQNHCKNCHYPELQRPDFGELLGERIDTIYDFYGPLASCVCFLGEGRSTEIERKELTEYAALAQKRGMKCCLYSGRDTEIEEWMRIFDYIKIGSYQPEKGPLTSPGTNQRMYKKLSDKYIDITSSFWSPVSVGK